jgi:hypothetical protein
MCLPSLRFTMRRLMIVVVILAVTFSLLRPLIVPPTRRAAEMFLTEYVAKHDPDFRLGDYEAEAAIRMPSGFWKVRFVRISGNGESEKIVMLADPVVKRFQFNPWASLDQPEPVQPGHPTGFFPTRVR